jgi:molybdopterin converting factor small subunit
MTIEVLLFAQLKEAYGCDQFSLELPSGAKIADAVDVVLGKPALAPFKALPLRYAVNEEFSPVQTALKDNDRLALLTPVAGG